MAWERSFDEWLAAGALVTRMYREELGREGDPSGWVNWLAHWREGDHGADFENWLRRQFRDSEEARLRHGSSPSGTPDPPAPELPPAPPAVVVPFPTPPLRATAPIRVTDDSDDVINRVYSYWPNAWLHGSTAYVFVGDRGGPPRFFAVDLATGQVMRLGSPLPYAGESEGWYWDADGRIYLTDGPRLRHVNPFAPHEDRVVFDITTDLPGNYQDCDLWQAHSSDDGQTHSATVRRITSGTFPKIGTVCVRQGRGVDFFDAHGELDESQVTPDGRYLVIKELLDGELLSNRIITVGTRETRLLRKADGAVGHSDCGPGLLIGEWSPPPGSDHGQCVRWDLDGPLVPSRRRELFPTWNMGHVSLRGSRCVLSNDTHISLVSLEGGGVVDLRAHGMVVRDSNRPYDFQVRANLDPTGTVATYITNNGTERFDMYLLVLPAAA